MKILFFGGLQCGGAEHQMVTVAKHLAGDGDEVFFATFNPVDFYSDELIKSGVHILGIPRTKFIKTFKLSLPYTILYLLRLVKKENIRVGIAFLDECNFVMCYLSKLLKGRFKAITGVRNARDSVFLSKRSLFYSKFERYASVIVCNSDNAKNLFANYFPQYADKLITIYNIVSLPSITSGYIPKKGGKIHIIVPASYREVKNPLGLLKALELMNKEELQKFDITWYGQTHQGTLPYYIQLKNEVERQGLSQTLILKEATTEIANRVNEADVIALFSSSEGLPNAICEGMMLGKPVIMTRVSDFKVLTEGNGILCDWDNPQSIKDSIIQMINLSDQEFMLMKEVSHDKANNLFSIELNVVKWKSIIGHNNI